MGDLSKAMHSLSKQLKVDIHDVMATSLLNISKSTINISPVETGRFRSNWFASMAKPIRRTVKSNRRDPMASVNEKITGAIKSGEKYFLTNNLPYARALEYGLYKKNPVRGSRVRGSKPARYEIRSINGYSDQAPKGVLRVSVLREIKNLTKLLNSDKIVTGGSGKRWS